MRVLIVEDDAKLAGLIQRALREQGTLADAARDGEDALWMADATPYDVMVLDINLPGISGFETCQQLRAARPRPDPDADRARRRRRPGDRPRHRRR